MIRFTVALALLVAGCSGGSDAAEHAAKIAELEQQNAQLQADLKQAKDNLAAMQRAMERGAVEAQGAVEDSGGGTAGQPDNNLTAAENRPAG